MFVFGYNSSYQMILSFPYLVVILTTIGTPKNIFCINNNIMNDNSKQNKTTRARTSLVVLYLRNYTAGIHGHYHESSVILNTPKNPYLNQATCQIFIPKKIPESKISNPKKSFDHPRHLKSGVPPLGTELRYQLIYLLRPNMVNEHSATK